MRISPILPDARVSAALVSGVTAGLALLSFAETGADETGMLIMALFGFYVMALAALAPRPTRKPSLLRLLGFAALLAASVGFTGVLTRLSIVPWRVLDYAVIAIILVGLAVQALLIVRHRAA